MTEPINVKMKLADPAEVDRLMKIALLESGWMEAQLDSVATACVYAIHTALSQAGCVIIQVDLPETLAARRAASTGDTQEGSDG
jgi:hypothetical protein